jgi:cytochrome P450
MNFISANFDESVFENPFEINLNRERNPHLSFGFGPHTCLGNHVAEIEARVFLEVLLESKFRWEIVSENIEFHSTPYEVVPREFSSLVLRRVS